MKFQRESVLAVLEEIKPLLLMHWDEVSFYRDIPLDPDYDAYIAMDEAGVLRVYTARDDDNKLIGYAVFFIRTNPHYKKTLSAVQDIIFIDQTRRGIFGAKFILWCEDRLREEGVVVVYHHIKVATPNTITLFKRLGYQEIDIILGKRLDDGWEKKT
jgi:hypothetical protein